MTTRKTKHWILPQIIPKHIVFKCATTPLLDGCKTFCFGYRPLTHEEIAQTSECYANRKPLDLGVIFFSVFRLDADRILGAFVSLHIFIIISEKIKVLQLRTTKMPE